MTPKAGSAPVISRAALAAFVWFVRLNPRLPNESDEIARAFEAYRHDT
jgi:hypothetical protein